MISDKCIICHRSALKLWKKVDRTKIYACTNCLLGITEKKTIKRGVLYASEGLYNLESYRGREGVQEKKFDEIILIIRSFLREGDILEVGAGHGLFARMLQKNKRYRTHVVEPNLRLVYLNKVKHRVKSYKKTYEEFLKTNKKKFKLVIFMDVLEHFKNPKAILEKTRKILDRKGLVLILLPNYKSLMANMSKNWPWWMVEDHKFHFSPRSLERLAQVTGYEVRYLSTFENFHDFRKSLDGNFTHIKNKFKRRFEKLVFYLGFFPLYFALRKLIWLAGRGGLICMVAQKRSRN